MFKQFIYISLVLSALLFSEMMSHCFADAASDLEQAKDYKANGYYPQAETIFNIIITENPGTDYALEAQKDLVFLYLMMQQKVGTNTDPQTTLNTLKSDYSTNPRLASTLYDIAAEYERLRKYDEAKSIYQGIIQQHSGSSYADKAQLDIPKIDILALIQARQDTAAQQAIDSFIQQYSGNSNIVAALNDIAYQWRRFKNFPKAIQLYQYIADTWSSSSDAMWAQMGVAKSNIEVGDFTAAGPALSNLTTNYAGHTDLPTAMHYIARSYRKTKKYDDAKSLYQQIIQLDPNSPHAANAQIEMAKMDILAYIKAGNYTTAQTATNQLISDFAGHLNLARMLYEIPFEYERLDKYEDAKVVCQKIITNCPDSFRVSKAQLDIRKCNILITVRDGNDGAVITDVNNLIADFTGHSYLPEVVSAIASKYYGKASQLKNSGNTEQARQCFQKAAAIYEKVILELPASEISPKACNYAGESYHQSGEYQKSNQCYQRILDDFPLYNKSWNAQFMLGRNYEKMYKSGLISKSKAFPKISSAYKQLLEKYPDCKAAKAAQNWLNRHNTQ